MMSPWLAPPFMIIMGNSVPPPSIRCTLVIWGQANLPKKPFSQASAVSVRFTATPPPQLRSSPGW